MRRGDIVLMVPPRELGKPRPGLVVQADELERDATTVIVCPLSSDIQKSPRLRPIIEVSPGNGLRQVSQVMTDKLIALQHARIRAVVGSVDAETMERVNLALLLVLGLAR
jgi:mRNA interferase MazF